MNVVSNANVTNLLNSNASIVSPLSANVTSYQSTSGVELRVTAEASSPFVLVLTEPYDRLWTAYVGNDEVKPTPIYGLVNGFLVNQTGTVNIRIYYTLQNYLYIGMGLSAASLSLLLVPIALIWRKNRRKIRSSPKSTVAVPIPAQLFDEP
ncbi:MAG: hypothetical protein AUJ07_06310 [Crenarchaeota archaeon 13_1_40CM_3_53_5]|nr:MAG: hypothetical protein AUJ07_06310 [Crenarchaeota archaeon 13_1_40CM_3_53_5]